MRVSTIGGPLAELVAALGGVDEFAKACGISRITAWRWGTGVTAPTSIIVRNHINGMAKRRGLPHPFP